jgi:hypothetical protein
VPTRLSSAAAPVTAEEFTPSDIRIEDPNDFGSDIDIDLDLSEV